MRFPPFCFGFKLYFLVGALQMSDATQVPYICAHAAEEPDVKLINAGKFNSKKLKAVSCWLI